MNTEHRSHPVLFDLSAYNVLMQLRHILAELQVAQKPIAAEHRVQVLEEDR